MATKPPRSFTSPRCARGSSCGCSRVETSPSWISSLAGISYAAPFLNKCREQTAIPVQHLSEALWPRCRRPDAAQEREPTFVLPPFRQTLFVSNTQPRSVPTKGLGAFGVFFYKQALVEALFWKGENLNFFFFNWRSKEGFVRLKRPVLRSQEMVGCLSPWLSTFNYDTKAV